MVSERGGMEGKVALITGGTSGIGKATALAAMGADVVVTGHDRERGEAVLAEIRQREGLPHVRGSRCALWALYGLRRAERAG